MRLLPSISWLLTAAFGLLCAPVFGVPITSVGAFGAGDSVINFDSLPAALGGGVPAPNAALSTQYASAGARFSAEGTPGALQATDAADASGRFGSTWFIYAAQTGGGVPKSGTRYAGGQYASTPSNMSDMRIDFTQPVSAFGMWIIDTDFSVGRLQAFTGGGALIESVVVPQVGEGGANFRGIDAGLNGQRIAYVILDGNNGAALDSSFVDDLHFRVAAAVPEPQSAVLLLGGLALLAGRKRYGAHSRTDAGS